MSARSRLPSYPAASHMVNRGGHLLVSGHRTTAHRAAGWRTSDPGSAGPPSAPLSALPPPAGELVVRVAEGRERLVVAPESLAEGGLQSEACFRSEEKDLNSFPRTEAADYGRN